MTPKTPLPVHQSFVDSIVNARWDPHSPPASDFRAAYVHQVSLELDYTLFGWLYYDGQDDFGRAGIPYFLAYYLLGTVDSAQLQLMLSCIEKGPAELISRQLKDKKTLNTIVLSPENDYHAARPGVTIPEDIRQKSQHALIKKRPIDWFVARSALHPTLNEDLTPPETSVSQMKSSEQVSEPESVSHSAPVNNSGQVDPQNSIVYQGTERPKETQELAPVVSHRSSVDAEKIEGILQEFVNKTMGIQGAALVSDEGHPIVSAIGLDENALGMLAGALLYSIQVTQQELNWSSCEFLTLRGPNNYVMLSSFQSGIYLLIKSAKIPMGLLEGIVKRMTNKLKTELSDFNPALVVPRNLESTTQPPAQIESSQKQSSSSQRNVDPTLASLLENLSPSLIPDDEEIDFDEDITYRGRPTSS